MAMAITLGIREQNTARVRIGPMRLVVLLLIPTNSCAQLASIFMLTWATQSYGFLTEFMNTPNIAKDEYSNCSFSLSTKENYSETRAWIKCAPVV